jgi:hypothetical protein
MALMSKFRDRQHVARAEFPDRLSCCWLAVAQIPFQLLRCAQNLRAAAQISTTMGFVFELARRYHKFFSALSPMKFLHAGNKRVIGVVFIC